MGLKARSQRVLLPAVAAVVGVGGELHLMAAHHNSDWRFCSVVEDLAGCSEAVALMSAEVASQELLHSAQYHCDFLEKVTDLDGMAP